MPKLFALVKYALVLGALVVIFPVIASSAPPKGLTANGRIHWNFEALAESYYGTASLCAVDTYSAQSTSLSYTTSACTDGKHSLSELAFYDPVFVHPRGSQFSLTGRAPNLVSNVEPITLGTSYILCSRTTWLVETQTGEWICTGR